MGFVGAGFVGTGFVGMGFVGTGFVGTGSVGAGFVGTGSVGAGSEPAPTGTGRDNDGTMHTVRHDHERIPYPIRHPVRQVLPGPCHDMTCLIPVHNTIHDFSKDTHAVPRANGNKISPS